MDENHIGVLMRKCITEAGMKQNKVGRALGLSPSRLSNYLGGSREPNIDILSKFASFFGKSLDYFSTVEKSKNDDQNESKYCDFLVAINQPVSVEIKTDVGIKTFSVSSRLVAHMIHEHIQS